MAGRAKCLFVLLAALPLAGTAAHAQSEYDALPKQQPVAAAPAPASAGAEKPVMAEPKQKPGAEKTAKEHGKEHAKEKTAATPPENDPGQKKGAALKEKDDDAPIIARRMAPSAAIPPWPGDEKGPKVIDFLGFCASEYDRCVQTVRDVGEKLPAAELCIPPELDLTTVTERVRKWATLRPDIHGLPMGRVAAAALRSIYPCKRGTPPARTAAEKGAPKAAKSAQ